MAVPLNAHASIVQVCMYVCMYLSTEGNDQTVQQAHVQMYAPVSASGDVAHPVDDKDLNASW